jgi:uncharacterized membrane protein (DUF4010 family)
MFPRVLVQIGILNLALLGEIWLPLTIAGAAGFAYAFYLYVARRRSKAEPLPFSNPFDLAAALRFGALYAFILLASRAAQLYLGDTGVLLASFLAGFADINAIVLGLSELSASGGLDLRVAAAGVVIAALTNTLVKGGIVLGAGAPALRRAVVPGMLLILAFGIGAAFIL